MKDYFELLSTTALFAGIGEEDLSRLIGCLSGFEKTAEKGAYLFRAGGKMTQAGIILSGSVHIVHQDFWGNRAILSIAGPGELFGESFSSAETEAVPVSVVAAENSKVLFLEYRRIISPCAHACAFHTRLIENMLRILARKNVFLTGKLEFLMKKTIREKLLAYLSSESARAGTPAFDIPFNRQELADYLGADRSALSAELGRMRDAGLVVFSGSRFELRRTV